MYYLVLLEVLGGEKQFGKKKKVFKKEKQMNILNNE